MTTEPLDPRAAQALHLLSRVRALLDQHERALQIPDVQRQCDLDKPVRSMAQALHYLSLSWNSGLCDVPEPKPAPPPPPPSIPSPWFRRIMERGSDTPEDHQTCQREAAAEAAAVARQIRVER